ncbi:MAG: hypothetical protein JWM68_1592 [Verrucomicrobiales bacterium]|nr:hypothetical protein [Verrucomicrobiales bacterium]
MYKSLDIWMPAYLARKRWSRPHGSPVHIVLCVCDHFEPFHDADKKTALERLDLWKRRWPSLISDFKDVDGVRPRHTFFYPIEQYDKEVLESLAEVCQLSGAEVEIHLHHDKDTRDGLRKTLETGKEKFLKHRFLSTDKTGRVRYGFIHGNWALDNSHQGRNCGVKNELEILNQTGCYADFTMPSAPHPTQTKIVNSLYYAEGSDTPKSHDRGVLVSSEKPKQESGRDLLLVQGPLGLNWRKRKLGFLPRIENADLTGANPPRADRMQLWVELGIHVQGRPDCLFIKLHTHGAIPPNSTMFLGDPMKHFHQHLMETYRDNAQYKLHYVTSREMVNILHGLEEGRKENPGELRDYRYRSLMKEKGS